MIGYGLAAEMQRRSCSDVSELIDTKKRHRPDVLGESESILGPKGTISRGEPGVYGGFEARLPKLSKRGRLSQFKPEARNDNE